MIESSASLPGWNRGRCGIYPGSHPRDNVGSMVDTYRLELDYIR